MSQREIDLQCKVIDTQIDVLRRNLSALKAKIRSEKKPANPVKSAGKDLTTELDKLNKLQNPKKTKTPKAETKEVIIDLTGAPENE